MRTPRRGKHGNFSIKETCDTRCLLPFPSTHTHQARARSTHLSPIKSTKSIWPISVRVRATLNKRLPYQAILTSLTYVTCLTCLLTTVPDIGIPMRIISTHPSLPRRTPPAHGVGIATASRQYPSIPPVNQTLTSRLGNEHRVKTSSLPWGPDPAKA